MHFYCFFQTTKTQRHEEKIKMFFFTPSRLRGLTNNEPKVDRIGKLH